jgi:hypothetical protein
MTDQEYKWGDDPGAALVKAAGSPLALQIADDIIAGYLITLRTLLETNVELSDKIASSHPAQNARTDLISACELVKPGTLHLLEKAADMLLEELEQQRKSGSNLYLVSCKTGRSVMPIDAKDVYVPPDYEGLDGKLHKSKPIVHPGISSNLAIVAHEFAKENALVSIAGQELAFIHLSAPERMVEMAKQKLSGVVLFENVDGPWHVVEFGRENSAGMEQSVNAAFHRIELFSSVLAKKILTLCGQGGRCRVGSVKSHRGAKHRWYSLDVRLDVPGSGESLGKN